MLATAAVTAPTTVTERVVVAAAVTGTMAGKASLATAIDVTTLNASAAVATTSISSPPPAQWHRQYQHQQHQYQH